MQLTLKYRPTTLDDVVGQTETVKTLSAELKNGEVSQCMLFVGPAGTGKTTIARIIANELDAEIFELDAASNNGIENIRQLQDEAIKKSIVKKCKCYLIDECHSLSTPAWQALLKIVEEPPENVYFIFCTTESNKIPATILSRVQRFEFFPLVKEQIINRLSCIAHAENYLRFNRDSVDYIASISHGCMRQAVNYLDKCISTNISDIEDVKALLGVDYGKYISAFLGACDDNDTAIGVKVIKQLNDNGANLKFFISSCFSVALSAAVDSLSNGAEVYLDTLQFILELKEHLMNEDMPYEYIVSKILLR